jgi:SOS-response transcriptional repressor LexA
MSKNIEQNRKSIFDFIKWYYSEYGYCPTLGEIEIFTILSKTAVHNHIKKLKDAGDIDFSPGKVRSITLPKLLKINVWICPICKSTFMMSGSCPDHPDSRLEQKEFVETDPTNG